MFVAMSGGVDSSVAAALIKKQGYSVTGVFMCPWQPTNIDCPWKQDREDALRVAAKLDIPLLTWDLSKEYEKHVAEYMIEGYRRGLTPNPDVMCNKFIKFGVFLGRALKLGADYIATGHYVRIKTKRGGPIGGPPPRGMIMSTAGVRRDRTPPRFSLRIAKDKNKDQSYFLYNLAQKQLKHCLFPIGDYKKDEIRKMARKFGLPNWAKKDSQGVCFVGSLEVGEFLKKRIQPRKGSVLRKSDGKILGEHDGAWFYTIGQRHGMGLSAGKPQYVVEKDVKRNILYVDDLKNSKPETLLQQAQDGEHGRTINSKQFAYSAEAASAAKAGQNSKLKIKEFNWINRGGDKLPLNCKVKTRYRQKDLDCWILKNGADKALVKIKENNIPIAPGQSAVFYKGEEVLGGGIIS